MTSENWRDLFLIILIITTIVCFIAAVSLGINLSREKVHTEEQRALKIEMEEKLEDCYKQSKTLEEQNKSLQEELNKEIQSHQITKDTLLKEQNLNKNLQEELDKLTRLKEKLEEDLKEALIKIRK